MESEEIENAINELEVRLERLRALYEQYFLGFEKIEPTVARKDVDRRIYVLRREKIRNTARRFRLQNIIQRYNTFQQYWQRICREIENGTYKRHLLRAERTVGPTDLMTAAARRRFGKERERSSVPPRASEPSSVSTASAPEPAAPAAAPAVEPAAPAVAPPRAKGGPPPPPKRPAPPLPPGATAKPAAPRTTAPAAPAPTTRAPAAAPPAPPLRATGAAPPPRSAVSAPKPAAPSVARAERPAAPVEGKVRDLHERLVAASRAAQRPAVSLAALEKTVKSTEATLRAKHPNRRIEFDIVLKNGKPVLKPIVR